MKKKHIYFQSGLERSWNQGFSSKKNVKKFYLWISFSDRDKNTAKKRSYYYAYYA
jgi:hypothetical protein